MLKTSAGGQTALAGLEKRLTGSVPADSDIPGSVRKGVRFILGGGATALVLGIFLIIATVANKNALTDSRGNRLSNGQFTSNIIGAVVTYLLLVALWVLMARLNREGRKWARIVSSALCAISTVETFQLVNSLRGGATISVLGIVYITLTLLSWLFGVAAIAMLWRSESNAYFSARAALR
jgi:hypothetical protein